MHLLSTLCRVILANLFYTALEDEDLPESSSPQYISADQLGHQLITLSSVSHSTWHSLLHLDNIKVGMGKEI